MVVVVVVDVDVYCISPTLPWGNPVSTKMLPEYRPVLPTASKVVWDTTVNVLTGREDVDDDKADMFEVSLLITRLVGRYKPHV